MEEKEKWLHKVTVLAVLAANPERDEVTRSNAALAFDAYWLNKNVTEDMRETANYIFGFLMETIWSLVKKVKTQ